MGRKIRVGFVGLQPGRSWAARAHLPALQALSDRFDVIGIANTSRASAEAAAQATGIPLAFENVAAMARSPEIDMISVTVRVPYHLELVREAAASGKHVYCEWPLGNGLAEGIEMARLVREAGVIGVVGTQARVAPEILYLRELLSEGYVGRVLSATITAYGRSWGAVHDDPANRGYMLERKNGATMLTIPMGHTLAAVRDVLGEFSEISSIVTNRRETISLPETGERIPFDAPDQVLLTGRVGDGSPVSMHYRGGFPRGEVGFVWEINGSDGDLRVTGPHGGTQQVQLSIEGASGDARRLDRLAVPAKYTAGSWPENINPANVARLYARMAKDIVEGACTAPRFDDGVELHRVIDAIEAASQAGRRVHVEATNRLIPLLV